MTTVFERIADNMMGRNKDYTRSLCPDWVYEAEVYSAEEIRYHREHGEVLGVGIYVARKDEREVFLYTDTLEWPEMLAKGFDPSWLDPEGAKFFVDREVIGLPDKVYATLEDASPIPSEVMRVLEGMGYDVPSFNGCPWADIILPGGKIVVFSDEALYPVWESTRKRERVCFHSTEDERRKMDEERASLDVYDTLVRSCYS